MKWIMVAVIITMLTGCANLQKIDDNTQTKFTYDFTVKGKPKIELFKNGRDFFANTYGDSRSVFRISDESEGTMIGRGSYRWHLVQNAYCLTDYHIRFAAKEEKARIQFEIIRGVPPLSTCTGWESPSKSGYRGMVEMFDGVAHSLDQSLNGTSTTSDFKNF